MFEYVLLKLHVWITCFKCILNIAYLMPIKNGKFVIVIKTYIVLQTKLDIQQTLRNRMSLLVDIVRPESVNTNNGNTARRCFQEPNLAAIWTEVNVELISRFSVILRTVSCHKVNTHLMHFKCIVGKQQNYILRYIHGFICRIPYTKF